jgi:prepilin-type N-terminal cleavage/methylation domain-containing protein
MPDLKRRGFTLVELLIALTLLGIITAVLYRTLVNNQRIYQKQTQVIDLQQNIRAAATILPAEFRELDATDGDIYAMSATSLKIRAMRSLGFMCNPPITGAGLNGLVMTMRQSPWFGRAINTTSDSLLIRYEGDEGSRMDDSWAVAKPTLTASLACPDGKAGTAVTVNILLGGAGQPANAPSSIYAGGAVRAFEVVTYKLYQSGSDWYIGLETSNGTQPLIGPVLSNGLAFVYYDSTGAVTALTNKVARIDITVRGRTQQPVRSTAGSSTLANVVDSITASVALRNNARF